MSKLCDVRIAHLIHAVPAGLVLLESILTDQCPLGPVVKTSDFDSVNNRSNRLAGASSLGDGMADRVRQGPAKS